MKHRWALLLGFAVVGPQVFTTAQSAPSAVEAELRRLNQQAVEMQLRNDVAAAQRLLADEYVFLQADGQISNKAQNVAVLGSTDFKLQSAGTEDVQVRVYGDVGLVIGRFIMKGSFKDSDASGEYRYMDVWVKRGGRWQNVASQATRLAGKS
jgi:ketosteroid isomerase-like protein